MHSVRFVREDALPSGHCWVMVKAGDDYVLFLKRSAGCAAMLEQAWGAFVRLSHSIRRAA